MQKKCSLAVLLVAVLTLAWALPGLASEIILTTYEQVTFTVTPWGGAPAGSLSATIEVHTDGGAGNNPYDYADDTKSLAVPGTVSVSPTPTTGAWLKTLTSSADSNSSPMILSIQMKGWGGQPSNPNMGWGFISQNSSIRYDWSFTAPDDAPPNSIYLVELRDNYTDHFQLKQGDGSPYPLVILGGYTHHAASASWPKGSGAANVDPIDYYNYAFPNTLSNFDQEVSDLLVLGVLLQLNPGETAEGYFESSSNYFGNSTVPVPIPAFALLLGSGLLGLGLAGFRSRMKKKT